MRKHKDDLLGGEWLNDSHIHVLQQLIKLDPDLQHIKSLQNLIFGQSLQFDIVCDNIKSDWLTKDQILQALYVLEI